MGLHFYEATTNNVRMPGGWFLAHGTAIQRWVKAPVAPLTLNLDVTTVEARFLIEAAVSKNPIFEVVVCYREEKDRLRMLIFKGTEEDLEGYEWDSIPSWYIPEAQIRSRYDVLSEE